MCLCMVTLYLIWQTQPKENGRPDHSRLSECSIETEFKQNWIESFRALRGQLRGLFFQLLSHEYVLAVFATALLFSTVTNKLLSKHFYLYLCCIRYIATINRCSGNIGCNCHWPSFNTVALWIFRNCSERPDNNAIDLSTLLRKEEVIAVFAKVTEHAVCAQGQSQIIYCIFVDERLLPT